jgi:uncharacterized protein involved in exopolysaccharide biosynthesis
MKSNQEMETEQSRPPKRDRQDDADDLLILERNPQISTEKACQLTDEEIAKMEIKEFTAVYRAFLRRVIALEKENEKNIQAMTKQGEAIGKLNVEVSELKGKLAGYEKVGDSVGQSGGDGAIDLRGNRG